MVIYTGAGDELPEEMVTGEHLGGLAQGKGPSAFDHNAGTAAAGPSSTSRQNYLEALLTESLVGKFALDPVEEQQEDPVEQGVVVGLGQQEDPVEQGVVVELGQQDDPIEQGVVVELGQQEDPIEQGLVVALGQQENPIEQGVVVALGQQENPVEEEGFTLVRSRKFGMIRGLHPEGPYISQPDIVCELEYPWIAKEGPVRKVKKWAAARKGRYVETPDGPAYFTYGTYGPNGSLQY